MTIGWNPTRLGEVVKIKHGFAFSGMAENADSSLPVVVGIGNFDYAGGFRFGSTTVKRFIGNYPPEFTLTPGDVLLAMTCQTAGGEILGIPGTVPDDGQTYLHNQRLGKVEVLDPTRIDLRFFFQLARWQPFNHHLFATASGSKILHTSPGRIEDFAVDLPPLPEQQSIAAVLGAVDDKIESNRRASEIALTLAETYFQQVAPVAATERLSGHATVVLGGTPSRKRLELWQDGTVPWIASGAANADIVMEPTELITNAALHGSAAKLMPKGATVVAITGATLGQVALLGIETSGNQSLVGVWSQDQYMTSWLHFALRASVGELMKSATGAAQQHVNKGNIADLMIPIPDAEDLRAWGETCMPLISRAIQLSEERQRLISLRDALLPALLSGRIRASDLEGQPE